MTAKASRARRRSLPRRELKRGYYEDVSRIIELSRGGFGPKAIAPVLRLSEEFVRRVLEETQKAETGGGGTT